MSEETTTVRTRPDVLIRSPEDRDEHARKGEWLGLDAEEHARFTWLVLKGEARPEDFKGLVGEDLRARVRALWDGTGPMT